MFEAGPAELTVAEIQHAGQADLGCRIEGMKLMVACFRMLALAGPAVAGTKLRRLGADQGGRGSLTEAEVVGVGRPDGLLILG